MKRSIDFPDCTPIPDRPFRDVVVCGKIATFVCLFVMKKLFIISALIIASLCSCIKGSKLVILAAEEDEYNKCREVFPEIECIRTGVGAGNVIKAC